MMYMYCLPYSTSYQILNGAVTSHIRVHAISRECCTHFCERQKSRCTVQQLHTVGNKEKNIYYDGTLNLYSSKRLPSVRNVVDITQICACASFTLIVRTSGLNSSLICVSAVFVLGECMKRMWNTVNTIFQKRYVQFEWLNMWTGIFEYPPFVSARSLLLRVVNSNAFSKSGYAPTFVSHIIGTRKWTRIHPFWLKFWFF